MSLVPVTRLGPGEAIEHPRPGDFILTHRRDPYSAIIRFGQRRHRAGFGHDYAYWSHAALVADEQGGLVEALAHGVVKTNISRYQHIEYHYIDTQMNHTDRAQAVAFACACVGQEYGWMTIADLSFVALTGSRLQFGLNGTEICSGLVARSLERGPYIFPKAPNTMFPADLAKHFKVSPKSGLTQS